MDRFKITLRISGAELAPEEISALLDCEPTVSEVVGVPTHLGRIPKTGRWALTIESKDCKEADLEDRLKMLFEKLPADLQVWEALAARYEVDVFCGLFLATHNRGFGLSAEMSKTLSDRGLEIGFDVYFDPPEQA